MVPELYVTIGEEAAGFFVVVVTETAQGGRDEEPVRPEPRNRVPSVSVVANTLEGDGVKRDGVAGGLAGEKGIDLQVWPQGLDPLHGLGHVLDLLAFERQRRDVQSLGVKGTVLVCDQDYPFQSMDFGQEAKLCPDTFLFAIERKVSCQARGSAGYRQAVVPRQLQRDFHEFVELIAETAVAAIDGRGTDPPFVKKVRCS